MQSIRTRMRYANGFFLFLHLLEIMKLICGRKIQKCNYIEWLPPCKKRIDVI